MTLPFASVIETMVLLKVAAMFAMPEVMFFEPLALRTLIEARSSLRRSSAVAALATPPTISTGAAGTASAAGAFGFFSLPGLAGASAGAAAAAPALAAGAAAAGWAFFGAFFFFGAGFSSDIEGWVIKRVRVPWPSVRPPSFRGPFRC